MKMTISVICGIILMFLGACGTREWTMPQWVVPLRLPLINEKYYIIDLADGENLIIDEDNVLVMQGSGSLSTPEFGSLLFNSAIDTDSVPITANIAETLDIPFVDLVNQYQLVYGVIESGAFETLFTDIDPSVSAISIVFHDIIMPDNSPLEIIYQTEGEWMTTDLGGCRIGTLGSETVIDEMSVTIHALSSAPDGTPIGQVRLRNQDSFSFGEFKGILHDYRLDLNETVASIEISYPLGIDQAVTLTEARLVIELENHVGFECTFHGEFFAENTITGETYVLPILDFNHQPFTATAADGDTPGSSTFVLEREITDLLQIMPDRIEIRNAYFIVSSTPAQPIGRVRMTDYIQGDYIVSSPFRFILHDNPIEIREPIKVEITQQNQDRIRENGRSASFDLEITNRLPIGAEAKLFFGLTENIDASDPDTYHMVKSANIQSADLNPSVQIINISLNREELLVFANPEVYMKLVFKFESSGGVPVTIYATTNDYLHLKSKLTAEIFVGEE